eukprot:11281271-Alexandrium_andersonii.AAC.1
MARCNCVMRSRALFHWAAASSSCSTVSQRLMFWICWSTPNLQRNSSAPSIGSNGPKRFKHWPRSPSPMRACK